MSSALVCQAGSQVGFRHMNCAEEFQGLSARVAIYVGVYALISTPL
jgi:hypothetical protein